MLWPITVVGTLVGSLAGGMPGSILGAVLGHALDRHWNLRRWSEVPERLRKGLGRHAPFEDVLFLCLGQLAKAEGRVLPVHLQLARDIMQQYRLDEPARLQAMHCFNRGKAPDARLTPRVRRLCRNQPGRAAELIDCCWRMALASGSLGERSRQLLDEWAQLAGVGRAEQQRMHGRHQRQSRSHKAPVVNRSSLHEAARLLGVDLQADADQIKRAYRRQLSRHHPDKLVASGAAVQDLANAGERIRSIQEAYERIRKYRGFR